MLQLGVVIQYSTPYWGAIFRRRTFKTVPDCLWSAFHIYTIWHFSSPIECQCQKLLLRMIPCFREADGIILYRLLHRRFCCFLFFPRGLRKDYKDGCDLWEFSPFSTHHKNQCLSVKDFEELLKGFQSPFLGSFDERMGSSVCCVSTLLCYERCLTYNSEVKKRAVLRYLSLIKVVKLSFKVE